MKFLKDIEVQSGLKDSSGAIGSAGQVLSSTGSLTSWIDNDAVGNYLPLTGGTIDGQILISNTFPALDFVDTNSFTDANDRFRVRAGANQGLMQWRDDSSSSLLTLMTLNSNGDVIVPNGNVGIGTTSPGHTLSVNGTVSSNFFRGYTYPNNSFLDFDKDDTAASNYTALASIGRIAYFADTNTNEPVANAAHEFFTGTSDIDTATSLMVINTNGNVGIGTTSPGYKLDISDSSSGSNQIALRNTGSGNAGIWFDASDGDLSGSDYAWIRQNNDLTFELGVDSLGGDMLFTEGGSERMRISSGNVGIGTTSPDSKLDVKGPSATPADGNQTLSITNSTGGTQLNLGTAENSYGWIEAREGSTLRNLLINPNGGNVGIGTTSPTQAKLVVDSSTTPQILVKNSSGTNSQILFEDNSGGTQNASITYDQAGENALLITTSYDSPTDGNRIYLQPGGETAMTLIGGNNATGNAGNVGIGTTSPTEKLSISGAKNTPIIHLGSTNNDSSWSIGDKIGAIEFGSADASGAGAGVKASISYEVEAGSTGSTNSMVFRSAGTTAGTNNTERMRITASGNVGIGTDSPGVRLDVSDVIRGRNSIRVDGAITGSPYFGLYQGGEEKAYIQYVDSGDNLVLQSDGIFTFKTATAERVRITAGGLVGIGITNPSAKLQVVDSVNNIQMRVGSLTAGISPIIRFQGKNAADDTNYYSDIELDAENGKLIFNDPGTSNGSIGQNPMVLDSSGNVGIGTTDPQASLQIGSNVGTSSEKLDVRGNSSGNYVASFEQDHLTGYGVLIDTDGTLVSEPALKIKNTSGNILYVGSNGNVGIGEDNPDSKLEVSGTFKSTGWSYLAFDGPTSIVHMGSENSTATQLNITTSATGSSTISATNELGVNVDNSTRIKIKSNGNVGIGTTNPSQLLHVAGNMRLQNQLYDSTNSEGSNGEVLTKVSEGTEWKVPAVNAKMPDNTAPASPANVGTIRYRSTSNTSFVDMSMQTGATTYTWVNIVSNFW